MRSILVDYDLLRNLLCLKHLVAIRDSLGRPLAYVVPACGADDYENPDPLVAEARLNLGGESEVGRSLAEILADLERSR